MQEVLLNRVIYFTATHANVNCVIYFTATHARSVT